MMGKHQRTYLKATFVNIKLLLGLSFVDTHMWAFMNGWRGFDSNVTCESHLSFKDSGIQCAFLLFMSGPKETCYTKYGISCHQF